MNLWALPPQSWFNVIRWWAMQRVKDADRFQFELERPPPGRVAEVTAADLDRDGSAFMAFAAAIGVKPQLGQAPLAAPEGVMSPDSSTP